MKQNIEWNQFITLSFEQVLKLQKLLDIKYHTVDSQQHWEKIKNHVHKFDDGAVTHIHTSYLSFTEKCTIGKMIEILGHDEWVEKVYSVNYDHNIYPLYEDDNLCDALWEAVKQVL